MKRTAIITAVVPALLLLSGCSALAGSPQDATSSATPEARENNWPEIEDKAHYEGGWDGWTAADAADNGQLALIQQWRTPEADAAAVDFLKGNTLYSLQCEDPSADHCKATLDQFAAVCQQVYDMDLWAITQLTGSLEGVTPEMTAASNEMMNIYCPEVNATYAQHM
jgi:hypothetical protein